MTVLTNNDLTAVDLGLKALGDVKLAAPAALRVARLIREVQKALENMETARLALLNDAAQRDEKGGIVFDTEAGGTTARVRIAEEKREAFEEAFRNLLQAQVEFKHTLSIADLGEGFEIDPSTLVLLGDLIDG